MKLRDKIIGLLMALNMLHSMPFLGFRYPSMVYALLIIVLFLLLCTTVYLAHFKKILPVFAIPFLNIFTLFVDGADIMQIFQYVSGLLQMILWPLAALLVLETRNYKLCRFWLGLYVVMSLITCVTTYYGNEVFPGASRLLATAEIEESVRYLYQSANIGGFTFVYGMVMFVPLLIYTWKERSSLSYGLFLGGLSIGFIVVIFLMLSVAEYTTSLLLFVLCMLLFFVGKQINLKKLLLLGCVGCVVFFSFKRPVSNMLWNISENVESITISIRLKDLSYTLRGDEVSYNSDLVARQDTYERSFATFLSNPFGCWTQKAVGGHSFFLDSLGKFGLLGLFLLCLMYHRIFKIYLQTIRNERCYGYALFVFLIFGVTSFINPLVFFDVMMFVCPLYCFLLSRSSLKTASIKQ